MASSIAPLVGATARSPREIRAAYIARYRDLVMITAAKTLKVRYRGSVLGVYWSLSNPLIMTAVYTAVFGSAFASYYGNSVVNYVLACFTGLAFLNFFSSTSSMALPSIVSSGALLNKIALPPSVFPVSVVAAGIFQLCVGVLPLLLIVGVWISKNPLSILGLLVACAALVLLTAGFSLAVSGLYVHFRDLPYMYELVVFVLWITSPIFYPAALVPAQVRPYLAFNPMAPVIESARQIVLSGERPNLHMLATALFCGIVSFGVGILVYRLARRDIMDLV